MSCPNCGEPMVKAIYLGLPGEFCESCNTLTGLAAYAPPVASQTEDGPLFKFMVYEGSYWRALWHWLTGR
ncbi:hypothetical protein [Telmatospirillum sp. J64-1]|uniref:hypothetical protein n=1 Tax=Telmatospirillum sp. J64-1 TaxID=2502183 RepID=UPI00115D2A6A|nr:hypothetical protein [Telmatospirillum sp. J64-1]